MAFNYTPTSTPSITSTISLIPSNSPSYTLISSVCPGLTPTATSFTPTPTPSTANCRINTVLNITEPGWIKYISCPSGATTYPFISSTGSYTITECIYEGTIQPGFPYAQVAVFTITSSGTPC